MQDASEAMTPERSIHLSGWVRIALIALGALAVWLGLWKPIGKVDLWAIAIALVGAWPILREAFSALLARKMTMELSMSIAIVAAFAIGESFTGLVIILFVLVAEALEHLTIGRGRTAIANLLELLPRQATVVRGGETVELPISRLACGEVVLVRPGARLPIDGEVVSGHSFVDQSAVTGESIPVEKVQGGRVYAGTINQSGSLRVQTTGIGPDTAFGKIIRAVEEAEKSRAPIQRTRIAWQAFWSISRSAQRRSRFSPRATCVPPSPWSSSRAPAASRRAPRLPFWEPSVARQGSAPS